MDDNLGTTKKRYDSDFDHLKVWQDNPDLYSYLSENHWNYQVNQVLFAYLKSRYEGNEVGVYINLGLLNGVLSFNIDYNQIYGVMFNEAYCFCSYVLTTPAPYTNIRFLESKAESLCPDNAKSAKPIVAYNILVMTGMILCFANDQNNDVGRFLSYLSTHNSSCYFGEEFQHFENYCKKGLIIVADIMAHGQLQPPGKLRPGYDYKTRDEYLRKEIVSYKIIAEDLEKNRSEANRKPGKEHGEHYRGRDVDIFHDNLDPQKIARAIIAIDKKIIVNGKEKRISERHFCLILYMVFCSFNGCLTTTKKSDFIDWVKYNCKIYFESNDLKKITLSDAEEEKIEEYKAIFAVKQPNGMWIFNRKFYKTDSQGNPLQSIEKIG